MKCLSELVILAADQWSADPIRVICETPRSVVFHALIGERVPVVIKTLQGAKEEVFEPLKREIFGNRLLAQRLPADRYCVPEPLETRAHVRGDVRSMAFRFVDGQPFAAKRPHYRLVHSMGNDDLNDLAEATRLLHSYSLLSGVPSDAGHAELSIHAYRDRRFALERSLRSVVEAGYISPAQAYELVRMSCEKVIDFRFAASSLVPWSLGRDAEGRLIVFGAKHYHWEAPYYNAVEWFSQVYIQLGDMLLAGRGLGRMLRVLQLEDPPPDSSFWQAWAYCLGTSLHAALADETRMARAMKLLPFALRRQLDFDALLMT